MKSSTRREGGDLQLSAAPYVSEPRTVGGIGHELGMDDGTPTPLLKRMAAAGLVARERDAKDERRVLIALTGAGEALREPRWAVPDQVRLSCDLSDERLAELRDTLHDLAMPIQSSADEGVETTTEEVAA